MPRGYGPTRRQTVKKSDIIQYYDETGPTTADEWYANPVLLPVIRDFIARMGSTPRVLDLGCGTGHESRRLVLEGAQVTGIDISPASVAVARERVPKADFHVMDFLNLDANFGPFDGIFASGSLIHLSPESLPLAGEIIRSLLVPGGYFLAIMQEGLSPRTHFPKVGNDRIRRTVYRITEAAARELFTKAGFAWDTRLCLDASLSRDHWAGFLFHLPAE